MYVCTTNCRVVLIIKHNTHLVDPCIVWTFVSWYSTISYVKFHDDVAMVACRRTNFEKALGGILHLDCSGVASLVSSLTKYLSSCNVQQRSGVRTHALCKQVSSHSRNSRSANGTDTDTDTEIHRDRDTDTEIETQTQTRR